MSDFPVVSGMELIKILQRLGFYIVRQKGSHVIVKHKDGRCSIIPVHGNRDLGYGLLLKVLKNTNISKKEFLKLIKGR